MKFNSKFITLELEQKNTTINNADLVIRIRRNSIDYHNLEGIIVKVVSYEDGTNKYPAIWYTSHRYTADPDNTKEYDDVLIESKHITNLFEITMPFTPPRVVDGVTQRKGTQTIEVSLIENEDLNPEVIVKGSITLTTLEVALPKILELDTNMEIINDVRTLVTTTRCINPYNLYTFELSNNLYGPITVFHSESGDNKESRIAIPEEWYRKDLTTTLKYFLGTKLILEKEIDFLVPSDDLNQWYYKDEAWKHVEAAWRWDGEKWVQISASWIKKNQEFLTRE